MPAATITTTSAQAFAVPEGKFGYEVKNVSDVLVYLRHAKTVATSSTNMGIPLEPGERRLVVFRKRLNREMTVMGIHAGTGNKTVVWDSIDQEVIGAVASSSSAPGDAAANFLGAVGGKTKTVDVTFSLDTNAYAAGDVLADRQVIAACMRKDDGTGFLAGFTLIDVDAQGVEMDVVFLSADVAVGTENSAVSLSAANALNLLGTVNVTADDWVDLVNSKCATKANINLPIKAVSGTDDIYVALVTRGTPTHTAAGITGRFHFMQD
ncbi:MAG: hypothetical protein R3F13_13275 [Prosthecobacter sp.]